MKEKTYAVLGLGRYGMKIAETVRKTGADIIVADSDSELIAKNSNKYTYAVSLDMGNIEALSEIGLKNVDMVIIDLETSLEQSIMCVMAAKECGVEKIIATASHSTARDILLKMGANEVVIPEEEAALRMARTIISEDFMEYIDIGEGLCVIKIHPLKSWVGKNIRALQLRQNYNANVIAMEEDGVLNCQFSTETILKKEMTMVVAINKEAVMEFIA